jgi:GTP cyclohydrolase FolE2
VFMMSGGAAAFEDKAGKHIVCIALTVCLSCPCSCALQADQPTPEAVVELSLPAKTQHSQTLRVSNWLHKPQRFK